MVPGCALHTLAEAWSGSARSGTHRGESDMSERQHRKYDALIARCKSLPATPCAVAHPCDESSLRGAVQAADLGLIRPILVGPRERIAAVAAQCGIDISALEVV